MVLVAITPIQLSKVKDLNANNDIVRNIKLQATKCQGGSNHTPIGYKACNIKHAFKQLHKDHNNYMTHPFLYSFIWK